MNLFPIGAHIIDAGCGPSGHISKYLHNKGLNISGVDISDECVAIAGKENPDINFTREDFGRLSCSENQFEGLVAYYSILDTPKEYIHILFKEFYRVIKPGGYFLIAVKEGNSEGYVNELLGIETEIYFSLFTKEEIEFYLSQSGFDLIKIDVRNPYDFEINNKRIFALAKKK